jgi:hypothetical protein
LGMVAYDFSVYNEPVVVASASLKAPSALVPKGAIQAAEVPDERAAVRYENNNTTGLIVELHPKPKDFKNYYEGRVMINTLPSAPSYWTSAQTEDRKVKITARLSPGAAANNKTVYFRVVDPDLDDQSPYEEDNIGGDNQATIDKPGHLSAPNAVAVVKPGAAFATAEVELTITDRYSGDNYRVECSLDPNFATVADATCTLVAWKRVGWRHHKMWKESSDLTETFVPVPVTVPPSTPTPPSLVHVVDASIFSIGDWVIVFDVANPSGERVQVLDKIEGNGLKVQTLKHSYEHGHRLNQPISHPLGRLAAVALERKGCFEYPNISDDLWMAFGSDAAGMDGGCFVEFKEILGGGVKVPFRTYYSQSDPSATYWDYFPKRPGEMNVLSANQMEKDDYDRTHGWSVTSRHFVVLYATTLMKNFPDIADRRNASAKIAAHEFMHVLSGHDDCTHEVAWDNKPGKTCLLNSPAPHDQFINGHVEGHKDHLDAVRANADFYNP